MSQYLLLKQGTIHNAVDEEAFVADILIEDGKIKKIAPVLEGKVINEAAVIDAMGIDVYPGFVDAHCHLGLDGYAVGFAGQDFNELGDPVTPQLSAIDAINPQDETFRMAREGGVTCVSTGPGSSNVIGGTFCIIKTYGNRVDDMIVREKAAMKIAFGENPKNCYKEKGVYSRMSVAAKLREVLQKTIIYDKKLREAGCETSWNEINRGSGEGQVDISKMPAYDAKLEAMLPVIRGEIPLKAHAHRADDILTAIRIAKEFDLTISLDHCTEGYLIADKIKEAREQGDLSENAEYDAARDEQRDNEAKIEELENLIKNAVVISDDDIDHNVANLGSAVTLKDLESGEEMEFSIVGSAEVNSLEFKISNESPLGKAMIGKKRGDIIKVDFMGNEVKYQVLDVKRY